MSRRSEVPLLVAGGSPVPLTGNAGCSLVAVSRVPQSPQNLAPSGFLAPHTGQPLASRAPHSMQNLRPASFSVRHSEQITAPKAYQRSGASQRLQTKEFA